MRLRTLIFFILFFLPSLYGMAQIESGDSTLFIISGCVIDNNQEPVEGCILSLLQVEDSTFVKHGLTGEDGKILLYPSARINPTYCSAYLDSTLNSR